MKTWRPTRRVMLGSATGLLIGRAARSQRAPEFAWRLGTNQPSGSPTEIRLNEMAAATLSESDGRLHIDVFADGRLGSDNVMLDALRAGRLELYVAGNNLGAISGVSEIPSLPFAFNDDATVFSALDGELGALIRQDLARNGLHAFPYWQNGFHQLTSFSKPILRAADLKGMVIRTPVQTMPAEFFRRFGAEPKGITFDAMYAALRDHVADGQTDPLGVVRSLKLYEVQRYLSLTSHWWSGFLPVAHAGAWERLPAELQTVLSRTMHRSGLAQRSDVNEVDRSGVAFLRAAGMRVDEPDRESFRSGLHDFYARWRSAYGQPAWDALERYSGALG